MSRSTATGSYLVAVVVGAAFVLVVGLLLEWTLIRRFYDRPAEDQILLTFGIGIVIVELIRLVFGGLSMSVPPPSWAGGVTQLGFMIYPTYRIAVMLIAAVTLLVLYLVLYRTRLGMVVRAGIEDATMVDILGINVYRVFLVVFAIGAMTAGYAGIVNAPVVALTPDIGDGDPGADFRRGGDRRRRLVLRRDRRRVAVRRNPEPDLDVQSGVVAGDAVRDHDRGARGSAAGPVGRCEGANDRALRARGLRRWLPERIDHCSV